MSSLSAEVIPQLADPLADFTPQELENATTLYTQLLAGVPAIPRPVHPTKGPTLLYLAILHIEGLRAKQGIQQEQVAFYRPVFQTLRLRFAQHIYDLKAVDLHLSGRRVGLEQSDQPLEKHSIIGICKALQQCPYLEELKMFEFHNDFLSDDPLCVAYFRLFAEVVEHCPLLRKVDFSNSQLAQMDPTSFWVFCKAFLGLANLQELILHHNASYSVDDAGGGHYVPCPVHLGILFDFLPEFQSLEKLDLGYTGLSGDSECFDRFCEILPQSKFRSLSVKQIDLSLLKPAQMQAFFVGLASMKAKLDVSASSEHPESTMKCEQTLEKLYLDGTELGTASEAVLEMACQGLSQLSSLRKLSVGWIKINAMSLPHLQKLVYAFPEQLEELDACMIDLETFSPECLTVFGRGFVRLKGLRVLNLSWNRLGALDVPRLQILRDYVGACQSLEELVLDGVHLQDLDLACLEIVCEMLQTCGVNKTLPESEQRGLHTLVLAGNEIGSWDAACMQALCTTLLVCKHLENLSLYNNNLHALVPVAPIVPLVPALDRFALLCTTLQKMPLESLNVGNNRLGIVDAGHSQMLCQTFAGLRSLDLSFNDFGNSAQTIGIWRNAIGLHTGLQKLDLSNNILAAPNPPPAQIDPLVNLFPEMLGQHTVLQKTKLEFTRLDHFAPVVGSYAPKPLCFLALQALAKSLKKSEWEAALSKKPRSSH